MKTAFAVLAALPALLSSAIGFAESCYQLSSSPTIWSKEPELLCIEEGQGSAPSRIKLTTGMFPRTLATFDFSLLSRARCIDCNADSFGIANPSNSTFNALKITFNGKVSAAGESGTVSIGRNTFYYRKLKR